MQTPTASGRSALALAAALATAPLGACMGVGGGDDDSSGNPECEVDDSLGPDTAIAVAPGDETSGFLCPTEDEDWYAVELGAGDALLGVELAMTSEVSPVEPTYAVWSVDAAGQPSEVVGSPAASEVGGALDDVHCVPPGRYLIAVRDLGDNSEDLRHAYRLVTTAAPEPDANEPNDDEATATALGSGKTVTGVIACAGDEDWYAVDVPDGYLLRVGLSADVATYQPQVSILDSALDVVVSADNPAGVQEPTAIDLYRVLPGGGRYYIVVGDDDGIDADPNVAYQLDVQSVLDADTNEPNNHPEEATPLAASAVSCGDNWSGWIEREGTVGAPGDSDWFALPLSGCDRGLIEAEVVYETGAMSDTESWELQRDVQAAIALVRSDSASPCADDQTCRTLDRTCNDGWDCEGYFNVCLPDELCAGATVCLPGGTCGANETERHYRTSPVPDPVTGPPPANEAVMSAPLFGGGVVYLRVSDFQSDGGAPQALYRLRVRVRRDPDVHEGPQPNNLYASTLTSDLPVAESLSRATAIPVHDCTAGDCCGSGTWVTGAISYDNDLDWYTYQHPCPGQDCMVRLNYQIDGGAVDHVVGVYHGASAWYARDFGAGSSGALGGLGGGDECFYAYYGHTQPYYVLVRDQADHHDWDPDQTYRLCVEKLSNSCTAPCVDYGDTGCGQP